MKFHESSLCCEMTRPRCSAQWSTMSRIWKERQSTSAKAPRSQPEADEVTVESRDQQSVDTISENKNKNKDFCVKASVCCERTAPICSWAWWERSMAWGWEQSEQTSHLLVAECRACLYCAEESKPWAMEMSWAWALSRNPLGMHCGELPLLMWCRWMAHQARGRGSCNLCNCVFCYN